MHRSSFCVKPCRGFTSSQNCASYQWWCPKIGANGNWRKEWVENICNFRCFCALSHSHMWKINMFFFCQSKIPNTIITPILNHTRVIFFLCFCVFWIWAHFSLSSPHCWKLELKLWNLKSFYHLRIRRKGRLAWIKTHWNDLLLPWFRLCWVNGLVFDAFFRSKLVRGVKLAKISLLT